ncbi:hypothetical protein PpBr36_01622 [Pyricularia pennisetigena]|uniref:hypothetical protein n=1 Tax=Pyricularia pennisetigena TaxID=1578925 RepID=UPI001152B59D|nr:hypothetical protein PpBr36_01622 [Pyricularia pennisetigena]TLS27969.1 hypothetical protein PpBr36_01622 [Pyricularia pennisetigena]
MMDSVHINNLQAGQWTSPEPRAKTHKPVDPPPPIRANQSSKLDRQVPRSNDLIPRYPPAPSVEDEASSLAKEHAHPQAQSPLPADEEVQCRGELEQNPILVPVHESNPERRYVHVGTKSTSDTESEDSPKKGGSGKEQEDAKPRPENESYKANTGRKYTVPSVVPVILKPVEKATPPDEKGDTERRRLRRSRSELPRIETDVATRDRSRNRSRDRSRERRRAASRAASRNPSGRNSSRERSRERQRARSRAPSPVISRRKSTAFVNQRPRTDYFDSPSDAYLSPNPTVIKHSTTGRDRAYFDMNDTTTSNGERPRSTVVHSSARPKVYDERGEKRSAISYERTKHYEDSPRRPVSSIEIPRTLRAYSDRRSEKKYDESSPRTSRRNISPPRSDGRSIYYGSGSPPRSDRRSSPTRSERSVRSERSDRRRSPPPRRYSERERDRERDRDRDRVRERERERLRDREKRNRDRTREPPSRSDSYKSQRSSHNSDESSDDYASSLRSARGARDSRVSLMSGDPNYLLSPESITRPSLSSRMSSRRETPLTSPWGSVAGMDTPPLPSPRSSYTFPQTKERRRGDEGPTSPFAPSPSPPTKTSPQTQHAQIPSLTASLSLPVGAAMTAGAVVPTSGLASVPNGTIEPIERMHTPMPPPAQRQDSASSIGSWQQSPYSPPPLQPYENGITDQQVVSFRQYSEDVSEGRVNDLPVCPRRTPQVGLADWLTFPQSNNFNICPDCYTGVFAHTEYAHMFVPAPFRPLDKPIVCDFGISAWYRIAWLMTRKSGLPNLQLLQNISVVDTKNQPCSGDKRMTRVWYTVHNPRDHRPVERFQVCGYCAGSVQSLFPNLAGVFQPVDSKAEPTKAICSLHFSAERLRFLDYFDLLEETSDRAKSRGSIPDLRRLYDKLRRLSLGDCARDEYLTDREWYTIRNFPRFTACEECFEQVVQPEIDRSNPLARQFLHRPQRMRRAACQLYSARMRRHFAEACRANDLDRLIRVVEEREHIEKDCKARIAHYQAQNRLDRVDDYERKWQRYE